MASDFFPSRPAATPTIYAYEDTNPQYAGMLEVGYTTLGAEARLRQIYPVAMPGGQGGPQSGRTTREKCLHATTD